MKMEDLETHVKNAFTKTEASKEVKSEEQVTKKASQLTLDLFGHPEVEEESFDKKAIKVENDVDAPKKVSQPECEESFSAKNQDKKKEKADTGEEIGDTSDPHVQGTGEGEEY